MSQAADDIGSLVNKGFVLHRPAAATGQQGRTFIVIGLYRSGTTLAASMLRQVGIFMGAEINDIVHEDEEVARLIEARDRPALLRLIASRNADYGTWGFKLPMLWRWFGAAEMVAFHNPHVIATFRDPLAVSLRASLSDYQAPMQGLQDAIRDLADMVAFVTRLDCPALLLSYEKALVFPEEIAGALARFCGLPDSDALRRRLVAAVEPNRPSYIAGARRRYEGRIEGVAGGRLSGWCRLTGADDPVMLALFLDDRPAGTIVADAFREDLRAAGFGAGRHGFSLDAAALGVREDAIVRIKVAAHGVELDNSGRRLCDYRNGT